MKITILDIKENEEEEILIKCHEISDELSLLLQRIKHGKARIIGHDEEGIHFLEQDQIYYFESVDQKVFAYCESEIYEVKEKLYELEAELPPASYMRSSKSAILNLEKIDSLSPAFGGRFEAVLKNGEKVIISRQYVPVLKERLGL